ncbi:unnamed protein product [Ascophyllum nodosum]
MKEHKTCVSPTACNHEDGRDVRCGTIDAGRNDIAERAPAPAPTQLHEKEQREKVNIRDLANHLILLAFEWLFAKDLLELRRVDKLFQDTSKESSLWKGIALHLWNSAMIDGHEANTAPANISLQASTLANVTMEDLCRCMAGSWPTQLDLDGTHRDQWVASNEPLQSIIDGSLVPLPLDDVQPAQAEAQETSSASCDEVVRDTREGTGSSTAPAQVCTGVVFRGALGGDRAVRSNLPFPWMRELQSADFKFVRKGQGKAAPPAATPSGGASVSAAECARAEEIYGEVQLLNVNRDRVFSAAVDYPHTFLAHVKQGAPFATLWPGHSDRKDAPSSCGGVRDPGSSAVASNKGGKCVEGRNRSRSWSREEGHEGDAEDEGIPIDFRADIERIPSSGPNPFFRAGFTAYYEITLGKPLEPLVRSNPRRSARDQCVAIGLATERFPLEKKQPGWDPHSWGLHSDDGFLHHRGFSNRTSPSTFGPGDTVGCGLLYPPAFQHYHSCALGRKDPKTAAHHAGQLGHILRVVNKGAIFFTKNGRYLGIGFDDIDVKKPLYPCVGLDSHCTVEFNFGGQPFAFDVPSFEARVLADSEDLAILDEDVSPNSLKPYDHAAAIRKVYSASRGLTNPRLLFPYLRLIPSKEIEKEPREEERQGDEEESGDEPDTSDGYNEAPRSQSEVLRRSLTRLIDAELFQPMFSPSGLSFGPSQDLFRYFYSTLDDWEDSEESEDDSEESEADIGESEADIEESEADIEEKEEDSEAEGEDIDDVDEEEMVDEMEENVLEDTCIDNEKVAGEKEAEAFRAWARSLPDAKASEDSEEDMAMRGSGVGVGGEG